MTDDSPLISIIVAYHNEALFIGDAVRSVLTHDYRPIELVLVDDGSSDGSREVIGNVRSEGLIVKHRRHDSARGLSAARNSGLVCASGDFITYLDGDDELVEGRLTNMLAILMADPTIDVLIGQDRLKLEPGATVPSVALAGRVDGLHAYIPSMLYARRVHDVVGGFDTRFRLCEDVDWINRAAALNMNVQTCDVLAIERRIHGDNLSYQVDGIRRYRMRSLLELSQRRRQGLSHYVDPRHGIAGR